MVRQNFNKIVGQYLRYRYKRVEKIKNQGFELQEYVRYKLISRALDTGYGRKYNYNLIKTYDDFCKAIPIVTYEDIYPSIQQMLNGEIDVLWPGKIEWFAKSSGTTNDKSKYLPISDEFQRNNLIAASWDSMAIQYTNKPDSEIFSGKSLMMVGTLHQNIKDNVTIGDVSAIMIKKMPRVGRPFYTPDFETALMADFEKKIEITAQESSKENVVLLAGVPTWNIILFDRVLEITGKKNILEVWPNLKTYLHGGVGFAPYKSQFEDYLPSENLNYCEIYNASEGYFALQDRIGIDQGMLLLLDNDIFYEFIPMSEFNTPSPKTLRLNEVQLDQNYVLIVSTSSGLWRYMPGDTVMFVSLNPYRIKITGRTKQFINVFGEEVMVSNTDQAIKETCDVLGCAIREYSVGPVWLESKKKGGHEWLIEFEKEPNSIEAFEVLLDNNMKKLNSDYEAKRFNNLALNPLIVQVAPSGTFRKWLENRGTLGGQIKIPRLDNTRKYLDEIGAIGEQIRRQ